MRVPCVCVHFVYYTYYCIVGPAHCLAFVFGHRSRAKPTKQRAASRANISIAQTKAKKSKVKSKFKSKKKKTKQKARKAKQKKTCQTLLGPMRRMRNALSHMCLCLCLSVHVCVCAVAFCLTTIETNKTHSVNGISLHKLSVWISILHSIEMFEKAKLCDAHQQLPPILIDDVWLKSYIWYTYIHI